MPKVSIENLSLNMIGVFQSHWREMRLTDVCNQVTDGTHDSPKEVENGFPLVTGKAIKNRRIDFTIPYNISKKDHQKVIARSKPERDDILFTNIGNSIGDLVRVQSDLDFSIKNVALFKPNKDIINPRFLEYYLFSNQVQSFIKNSTKGSAQAFIGLASLRGFPVPVPPKAEQNYIAKLLGDLDDKIELNHQTNQTLEQIAQALFKSWFVDFDPVKAKIAAKQAGGNAEQIERAAMAAISGKTEPELDQLTPEQYTNLKTTAAFFPDELIDSELGEIPEGWEVKSLDEIAHYQNGLALQKFRPKNEQDAIPVLKIAQLKKGYADGVEQASSKIKAECIVNNGDIVFSWSGSLMVDIWCGGKVALNQHLFKVTSDDYPKWFYYYWTKTHLENFQQIAADKAVTMGHIKREHLTQAKCLIPAFDLKSCEQFQNLVLKQTELQMEIFTLQELRDSLLPKLLAGELLS